MSRADEVLEQLLASQRFQDSRIVKRGGYRDEPILRTGRQALAARPPKRFRQMRAMGGRAGDIPSYRGSLALFYRQARFMADYTDDQPYRGEYVRYYPTYNALPDKVLRGYFTWRTAFRAGEAPEASEVPLTFCFLYAYELLCGIGIMPGADGVAELGRLAQTYGVGEDGQALCAYVAHWTTDYVVYYGLDPALVTGRDDWMPLVRAVSTLRRAEDVLVADGARGTWDEGRVGLPRADELLDALTAGSRYKLGSSKLAARHREELAETCAAVFARLVDHCARRRKTGLVDGFFGPPTCTYYAMFRNANFYAEHAHPDAHVQLTHDVAFDCSRGSWKRSLPLRHESTSVELGDILHEVDAALRVRLGDVRPLKPRELPRFERRIVDEEADRCVARRRAEAARPKVHIDLGQLAGIRQAAARTREALLVDEEREGWSDGLGESPQATCPLPSDARATDARQGVARADGDEASEAATFVAAGTGEHMAGGVAAGTGASAPTGRRALDEASGVDVRHGARPVGAAQEGRPAVEGAVAGSGWESAAGPTQPQPAAAKPLGMQPMPAVAPAAQPAPAAVGLPAATHEARIAVGVPAAPTVPDVPPAAAAPSDAPSSDAAPFGLAPKQIELVRGLLDGTFDLAAYQRDGTMATVEADAVDEALFDLLGDTAIEFDGDMPHLVEDYVEDIREALS